MKMYFEGTVIKSELATGINQQTNEVDVKPRKRLKCIKYFNIK